MILYPPFACADASPPLIIRSANASSSLAGYLDILEDKTGKLTIKEVSSPEANHLFHPDGRAVPHFGATSSVFWVRFAIGTESHGEMQQLLELEAPLMDYVDLYIPSSKGGFNLMSAGEMRPMSRRKFRHRNPVFPLIIDSKTKIYYLRIDARGWASIPLTILTPNAFVNSENHRGIINGSYFGAMLMMVVYNLFIFISLRDKAYLYYFLNIFGIVLTVLSIKGLHIEFISEDMLWINDYAVVLFLLPLITGLLFCRSFLDTANNTPFIDRILKLFIWVASLLLPAVFILPLDISKYVLTVTAFLSLIATLIAGVVCLVQGYHPARYFIAARIFRITGILSYTLALLFPVYLPTLLGLQIGSALEAAILAFALADRINIMRREKRELQAETIRTSQLAALGELAAGVAHEVNTPVNTIINSADLILENEERKDTVQDVETIKDQGRRISTIARSLLFFSRLPEKEKVPFSIAAMLQGTLDMIGAKLRQEHIDLTKKIPDDLMGVMVHPQQIEQVFLNVLTNAIHALDERHGNAPNCKMLKIEVSAFIFKKRPFIKISFLDNGIGIPASLLDNITSAFITTKKNGVGLGLSISRKILEEHGGLISLESSVGEYTKVSVDLPAILNT